MHSAVFGEGTVTTLFRFKLEIVVDPITKETFLSKTCPMGALIDKRAEEPVKDDFRVPNELGKLSEDTVVRSTFLILLGPMTNGFVRSNTPTVDIIVTVVDSLVTAAIILPDA